MGEAPPTAAHTYSPDGRWYWDGRSWLPVPETSQEIGDQVLHRRARWTMLLLGVAAISTLPVALVYVLGAALESRVLDSSLTTPLSLLAYLFIGLAGVALLAAAVLLAMWCFRAHRRVTASDVMEPNWTPQWAALSWFIPGVNYVVPFLVLRELWSVTRRPGEGLWPWLWVWEAAWAIGAGVTPALQSVVGGDRLLSALVSCVEALALGVAAAILIPFVGLLTRRLEERLPQP